MASVSALSEDNVTSTDVTTLFVEKKKRVPKTRKDARILLTEDRGMLDTSWSQGTESLAYRSDPRTGVHDGSIAKNDGQISRDCLINKKDGPKRSKGIINKVDGNERSASYHQWDDY